MPVDLPALARRKPWPGEGAAHLLAMMAAVGTVALAKRLVKLAKRLDPDL